MSALLQRPTLKVLETKPDQCCNKRRILSNADNNAASGETKTSLAILGKIDYAQGAAMASILEQNKTLDDIKENIKTLHRYYRGDRVNKAEIQNDIDELFNTLKENKYLNTEEHLQIADNYFVFHLRYAFKYPSDKRKSAADDFRSLSDTLCKLIKSRETAGSIIKAIEHSSCYVEDDDFKKVLLKWQIKYTKKGTKGQTENGLQ